MDRTVCPEILDALPATDARAVRSRRDLQRINRLMGSCSILNRAIREALASASTRRRAPLRILELGAGDGSLARRVAMRLATCRRDVELTLLDRHTVPGEETGIAFAHSGWAMRRLTLDAREWALAPTQEQLATRWDLIVTNLFLHHFEADGLRQLLSAIADRGDAFVACEPRRALPALMGSRLLFALGVSADTCHDARISVRAGFRGHELSRMWPAGGTHWLIKERPAGLFSHLFVAARARRS